MGKGDVFVQKFLNDFQPAIGYSEFVGLKYGKGALHDFRLVFKLTQKMEAKKKALNPAPF
jgi:hypothetical protein